MPGKHHPTMGGKHEAAIDMSFSPLTGIQVISTGLLFTALSLSVVGFQSLNRDSGDFYFYFNWEGSMNTQRVSVP